MFRRDNRPQREGKKPLGNFWLFVFAILLIFFAVQSLTGDNKAKVSFSHQLQHLVNLDLIDPAHSYKVAQNDKLVTFSGKFRTQLPEDAKQRFEYLQLLNREHDLNTEKVHLQEEMIKQKEQIASTAKWFLEISGMSIPAEGFVVVSPLYDTPEKQNSIIISSQTVISHNELTFNGLKQDFQNIKSNPTEASVKQYSDKLSTLLQYYRSPNLGIGSSDMKQKLKEQHENLLKQTTMQGRLQACDTALVELTAITTSLEQEKDHARLTQLRPVRNYLENLNRFGIVEQQLENNTALYEKAKTKVANVRWFYNNKELSTKSLEKQDAENYSNWFSGAKQEWNNFATNKGLSFKVPSQPLNLILEKRFPSQEPSPGYMGYVPMIALGLLLLFLLYFLFARQIKGVGSSAMNFGKSPAKLLTKEAINVTFKDVAGADEAKEELEEIVGFLKDPHKYTALGARIPKGVLLVGAPGTGKTLVAKAVAGEADCPFFSISGSDFVEMFVGVGASRIRDLFDTAKKNAPCIIFIDEIDAVGRQRGAGIGGGHDEREQTLNQLLVEMDGFDTKQGVILMAATNRPDILDKALLRPGRFDRNVTLDLPDVKGRCEILKVHARRIKIDPSVNLMDIARITPGASGADLENILNEAALLAARRGRSAVTMAEVTEASDKVRFGKERRSLEMNEEERKSTAYHESGHTIVGLKVKYGDPIDKVTIMPRGFALGATHFMPKKNRLSYWRREVVDQLAILMGGRAAEETFLNDMSSGAQQDLSQATKLARAMVCEWGMSDLGVIAYEERDNGGAYLGLTSFHEKNYSDETAKKIDSEVYKLLDEAHKRAKTIVEENKDVIELMASMLVEFETLDKQDIQEIIDGKWNADEKRSRIKIADDLHKKVQPPPPPKKEKKQKPMETGDGTLPDQA